MNLLLFDLDNTVWNKQELDNRCYEAVSKEVFGRPISMFRHPITRKEDPSYAAHTNHQIWQLKLQQILEAENVLLYNSKPVHHIADVNIADLIGKLGEKGLQLATDLAQIQSYFDPAYLSQLQSSTTKVAAVSSGSTALQDDLLTSFGYYHQGFDFDLCSFGTGSKEELLEQSLEHYVDKYHSLPHSVVYVGDSIQDMSSAKKLQKIPLQSYAIGVETGIFKEWDLTVAGADLVLSSLASPKEVAKLQQFMEKL